MIEGTIILVSAAAFKVAILNHPPDAAYSSPDENKFPDPHLSAFNEIRTNTLHNLFTAT